MSGQQIEDLGDYLQHTELRDNWNYLALDNTDAQSQRQLTREAQAARSPSTQNPMELVSVSLGQHQKESLEPVMTPTAVAKTQRYHSVAIKPAAPKLPGVQCQSIWSSDDSDVFSSTRASTEKRSSSVISPASEGDRGFRKKSREKMRRQEVNNKFEVLIEMLGFSNRVRKKIILHETVSAINSLKRECNQLRRGRDLLQQEVDRLATCVQHSQVGLGTTSGAAMEPIPCQRASSVNPSLLEQQKHQ